MSILRCLSAIVLLSVLSTLLLAAQAPALKNPGFEGGMDGWHPMPETPGAAVAAVKVNTHDGELSLELKAEEGKNPWVAQGLPDIIPHATYLLTVYVQHDEGVGRGAVKLEFYDAQDKYLGGHYGLEPETPTGDWTSVQVRAGAPDNAAKAAVILRMLGAGAVYYDDVSFSLVAPPPAFRLSPARLTAPVEAGAKVSLTADLAPTTQLKGDPQAFVVGGGAETPKRAAVASAPGATRRSLKLEVTLPQLAPGFYRLQIGWPQVIPATVDLVLLPSGQRPAEMDDQARFVQGGEVFVPVGVYHVRPEDFPALAQAGFTVAQIGPPAQAGELQTAVVAAREAKLRLLVPLYPGLANRAAAEAAAGLVKHFSGEETIFGWLLADQPEVRADLSGPLTDLYIRVRQADATHPCFLTAGPEADLSAWAPLCDALLVQAFPRAGEAGAVTKRLDEAGDAVRATQPWAAVLAAGWPGQGSPEVEEARAWLYRAMVDGSTGALWFSLREGDWDLTASPLWEELPRLNAEAVQLGRAFQQGESLGQLELSVEQVSAQAVKLGEEVFLVLFNESTHPLQGAVRLPMVVTHGTYLDGAGEANVRSRTVRFDLPPGGARAIRLTLAPAGEQPAPAPEPPPAEPSDEAGP